MWKIAIIIGFVSLGICLATPYVHPLGRARSQRTEIQNERTRVKSQNQGEDPDEQLLEPKMVVVRDDLKNDEPSCDQLKAMWRFSKRQARAPELLNDIVPYTDPFTNNKWPVYPVSYPIIAPRPRYWNNYGNKASLRSSAPYGRLIHMEPKNKAALRPSSFDVLYGVLSGRDEKVDGKDLRLPGGMRHSIGPLMPQKGKFQKLKEMIQTERAKELKQQREAEQLAARAAYLKDLANGKSRDSLPIYENEDRLQNIENPLSDEPAQPKNRNRQSLAGLQFSRYGQSRIPLVRRSLYESGFLSQPPELYPEYYQPLY